MQALFSGFQASGIYFPLHGHIVVQAGQSVIVKGSNQGGLGILLTHCSIHCTFFKLASKFPGQGVILLHMAQTNLQREWGKLLLVHVKEYWPAEISSGTIGSLHAKCSGRDQV